MESMLVKQTLVMDGETGELVKATGGVGKSCENSDGKAKSHSESEQRRRDRINAHYVTLRGLVPSNEKMDKATLLAEVIRQIKQQKNTATKASEGLHIPMDNDEVLVEKLHNNSDNGSLLIRASLCCNYRPDLLSEVRQAINDLTVRVLNCNISTLKDRVKIVYLITNSEDVNGVNTIERELIISSVRSALSMILDKVSASVEFAEELCFPRKRQRVSSYSDPSCSSL